jgi:UPF0716 family protein affecting phage T7 exclusion
MNINQSTDIRQVADGSIDYAYYAARGSMARHHAVKSLFASIARPSLDPGFIASLFGLAIIVPFMAW